MDIETRSMETRRRAVPASDFFAAAHATDPPSPLTRMAFVRRPPGCPSLPPTRPTFHCRSRGWLSIAAHAAGLDFSTATKADWGICTFPTCFIRRLPSFWRSSSFRLRVMSPP